MKQVPTGPQVPSEARVALWRRVCLSRHTVLGAEEHLRIVAAESVDDEGIELALSRRTRSSLMFFTVKSPIANLGLVRASPLTRCARTGLPFGYDDSAPVEDFLQLLQVEVTLSGAGIGPSRNDRLFHRQLDDQGLHMRPGRQSKGEQEQTRLVLHDDNRPQCWRRDHCRRSRPRPAPACCCRRMRRRRLLS